MLQIEAVVTNQDNRYYKIGQLLQVGAKFITNWGQVSQIRTIIRNWGITGTSIQVIINSLYNYFVKHLHAQNNVEILFIKTLES